MENKKIDVGAVASLARLSFSEAQQQIFGAELDEFIAFAGILEGYPIGEPDMRIGEPTDGARSDAARDFDKMVGGLISVPLTVEVDK